jgi:hypothetical protein
LGKVVTSSGLQDFIETGAVTEVKNHVKGDKSLPGETPVETTVAVTPPPAPPKQPDATAGTAPEVPPAPAPEAPAAIVPPAASVDPDDLPDPYLGLSEDDKGYILAAPDESERVRRLVGKRHKIAKQEEALRKTAEEEAKDAEAFAKNQFERARLAEARAAELERELQSAKTQKSAPAAPAAPEPPKAPDIKEFTSPEGVVDWSKFIDAKDQFADARAAHAAEQERAKIAQEKQAEERAKVEAEFRSRLEKAQIKYPDFLEVVGATDVLVQDAVLQFVTESDYGADITYYMANHPDFTDRIRKLSPAKAVAEVGKLELAFEKPAAVTPAPTPTPPPAPAAPVVAPAPVAVVPPPVAPKAPERGGAPPPITPISAQGSGTVVTDPSKMDFKQLRAYEKERARSKRR